MVPFWRTWSSSSAEVTWDGRRSTRGRSCAHQPCHVLQRFETLTWFLCQSPPPEMSFLNFCYVAASVEALESRSWWGRVCNEQLVFVFFTNIHTVRGTWMHHAARRSGRFVWKPSETGSRHSAGIESKAETFCHSGTGVRGWCHQGHTSRIFWVKSTIQMSKNWETKTQPVIYYFLPESSVMQQVYLRSGGVFSAFLVFNRSEREEVTIKLLMAGNNL